jgi:hypothetical protein
MGPVLDPGGPLFLPISPRVPQVLDKPLYDSQVGEIEKANLFAMRHSTPCRRAGYPRQPTIHDFKAGGLHIIGKIPLRPLAALARFHAPALTDDVDQPYSRAQRMKHGGHLNQGTHRNHYQPNNPGTDAQNAYLGGQPHTCVTTLFRGMTVSHSPNLSQSLPTEKKYEIETSPEFVALDAQLRDLNAEPPLEERERRYRQLYTKKHKLTSAELHKAQES